MSCRLLLLIALGTSLSACTPAPPEPTPEAPKKPPAAMGESSLASAGNFSSAFSLSPVDAEGEQ